MSYATLDDLARIATGGWLDLAQRAVRDARVTGELLRTLAEGGDTSGWPAEVVTVAGQAITRLTDSLGRASRHADTYIAPRYQGVLPLPAELVAGSDLPSVVAAIAYRRLYGATLPKELQEGTRWADDYLRDLGAGRVSLGAADTAIAQPPGRMVSSAPQKTIDWSRYP